MSGGSNGIGSEKSPGGIAAVREDRLAGDPPTFAHEEPDEGHNVLDFRQPAKRGSGLVIGHRLGAFLAVENGVSIGPGPTAVTEMPRPPNFLDAARVKCSTDAFIPPQVE